MPERKDKIKFYFENPPKGKYVSKVTVVKDVVRLDSFEASKFLGITRRHLYNLVNEKKLVTKWDGGRMYFRIKDLDKWMVKTGRRRPRN